jgi:hypothetical protein
LPASSSAIVRQYSLCALLFVACEVAALGCGIASGKEDSSGRAALIISAASLVLSVLLYGFLTPYG